MLMRVSHVETLEAQRHVAAGCLPRPKSDVAMCFHDVIVTTGWRVRSVQPGVTWANEGSGSTQRENSGLEPRNHSVIPAVPEMSLHRLKMLAQQIIIK